MVPNVATSPFKPQQNFTKHTHSPSHSCTSWSGTIECPRGSTDQESAMLLRSILGQGKSAFIFYLFILSLHFSPVICFNFWQHLNIKKIFGYNELHGLFMAYKINKKKWYTDVMLAYFPTPHLHQFTVMKYSQPFDDQYLKLYNLLLFRLG